MRLRTNPSWERGKEEQCWAGAARAGGNGRYLNANESGAEVSCLTTEVVHAETLPRWREEEGRLSCHAGRGQRRCDWR